MLTLGFKQNSFKEIWRHKKFQLIVTSKT